MRWDNLFDDLEGRLEYELSAEEIDLRAEEERLRLGRISLRDRLMSLAEGHAEGSGYAIRVQLASDFGIRVRPKTFGKDWLAGDLVDESDRRRECILPLSAIAALILTAAQIEDSMETVADNAARGAPRLSDRIGLAFVLRDLCRRRKNVEIQSSGDLLHGTIDRVGRDHLDLAIHEPGSSRREPNVLAYRVIPLAAVLLIRL
ncbi:MAG: hypothetical protein ABI255_12040 [Microbacteriaceae bacterium]